jgi:dTDP-glucose 4,6-dehydratase
MRILIFGSNGWIGQQFQSACERAKNAGSNIDYRASRVKRISLDTQSELIDEFVDYSPTHAISFIGRTHGTVGDKVFSTIDYLEQEGKLSENLRDNLTAPLLLAYICKYAGVHFTYLGTGCIFAYRDGEDVDRMLRYDADGPETMNECYKFKESDAPNFFGSSYSIVKGVTDRIMQERNCICESVLNLRIRMPIINRDNSRNFITKITNYPKICSLPNSMTVLDEFLPYALVLMQHRHTGTLNFVNPGVISHNEILQLYRSHVNPDFTWTNFTVEEQNEILASKRSNNYLDNEKLLSIFPKARPIYNAVQDSMRVYNRDDIIDSNTELHLDRIECTLHRMRLAGSDGDGDDCVINEHCNNRLGVSSINMQRLHRGGELLASAAAYAGYAGGECTRILSSTVGELYTKMLSVKNRIPIQQEMPLTLPSLSQLRVRKNNRNNEYEMTSLLEREDESVEFINHDGVSGQPPPIVDSLEDCPNVVICVTGGAGFIGSHYINYVWRSYKHIRIINVDCLYYCANLFNIDACVREDEERYKFRHINLADSTAVNDLNMMFKEFGVTHVVHFAAQSHVQNSFGESLQYTQDNVVGTHNLLEASRQYAKLQLFVHVSTDEVYGESMIDAAKDQHKTEQSILCPTNPYAATKAAAELIAQSYYHSFKLPLIITRGNNVYGPNQYPEKLIPRFIQLLREDRKLTIQGDGSNLRSFIHVSDVCRAFDVIIKHGSVGEIYNIGSNAENEYSVLDVAKLLIKLVKGVDVALHASAQNNAASDLEWIEYVEDRPFNDKRYYISNDKLKQLGWDIQTDFVIGLTDLVRNGGV